MKRGSAGANRVWCAATPVARAARRASVACALLLAAVLTGAFASPALAQAEAPLIDIPFDDAPAAHGADDLPLSEDRFIESRRGPGSGGADAPLTWVSPLRPVRVSQQQSGSIWRFTGEQHREVFSLHVADPALSDTLRISSMSTVNALPERSSARVTVNGTEVGRFRLQSFTEFSDREFEIPAGVLLRGRNEVSIEVVQHHRIFCGPDASWALWTEFDLSRSGIVIEAAEVDPGPHGFLMALAAQAGVPGGLEVRGADRLGEDRAAWIAMLNTRLGNAIGGQPLALRFTGFWTVVSEHPTRARVTFLPGAENRVSFRRGADGAQVMLIEFRPGQVPDALPGLEDHLAGLPQTTRPELIDVTREVALSEFGFRTERYAQRYVHREFAFRLPDDWLVLTAAKARLRLDYIYADGLPHGSVLILSMNGNPIRMLPLWGEPNRYITRFPIDFEARLLTAGTNVFSYEVLIPGDPPDMPCSGARGAILEIHQDSTLSVPFSPRMYLPDMGLAFTALAPASLRSNDLTHRAFGEMDKIALASALSRAVAGYRPGVLHLMALDDLGSIPLGRYSVDRHLLEEALLAPADRGAPDGAEGWAGAGPDPFRFVQDARNSRAALAGWWDWAVGHGRRFLHWVSPRVENRLNEWLAAQRGQAVFLQLDDSRPDHIWMLRSPDADMGQVAAAIIAARSLGDGPRGQVSVLGHDGQWHNWMAPDRRPVMLEPWTFTNFRAAMGNIVSARPITFVTILFFFALLSAALALRLTISTREHDT